jgi:ABC-2 type transport system permease protein
MVGLGAVAGFDTAAEPVPPVGEAAWQVARVAALPALFALLTLAVTAVTADYATAGIVPTLQWTPRRSVLLASRTLVVVATATAVAAVLALACGLTAYATAASTLTLEVEVGLDVLGAVAVVVATGTALGVGLGLLLRSTAGALVSVFLLVLVLPVMLPQLGYDWAVEVAERLPGTGALFLLLGEPQGRGLTELTAGLTMLGWAAGALLLGGLRLVRDDADR